MNHFPLQVGVFLLKPGRENHKGPEKAGSWAVFLKDPLAGNRQISREILSSQRPPTWTQGASEPHCGVFRPHAATAKKIAFPFGYLAPFFHLVVSSFKNQLNCAFFYGDVLSLSSLTTPGRLYPSKAKLL